VPDGIVSTGYPAVAAKCRDMGIGHDDWQQGFGRLALGKRSNGKYAATVGGVVISWMRQVGKTYTVGSILFALCILFPRLTVLWTAHHSRTTDETFQAMQAMAKRRKVAPHIAYVRAANGQQAIGFVNGSRIMFGAREHGFGRGFAAVDVVVFDEGQILSVKTLEDMVAATNQSRHPAGALLFYMGTPPRATDPGDAFRSKRAKALSGKSRDMVYVEISGDPDADPDDEEQWKHNPSYPHRTPRESMLRLRENVGSDESWLREGLGIWDELGAIEVFGGRWPDFIDPNAERGTAVAFGVAVAPDRSWAAVAVAWHRDDGKIQVQLVDDGYRPGTAWVTERAEELRRRWGGAVIASTTARGLIPDAVEPSQGEQALAHTRMDDEVMAGRVRHGNDAALNTAVRAARWRAHGDTRMLDRKGAADISPLDAAALALHGHLTAPAAGGWAFAI
jgi:hypothetical protein